MPFTSPFNQTSPLHSFTTFLLTYLLDYLCYHSYSHTIDIIRYILTRLGDDKPMHPERSSSQSHSVSDTPDALLIPNPSHMEMDKIILNDSLNNGTLCENGDIITHQSEMDDSLSALSSNPPMSATYPLNRKLISTYPTGYSKKTRHHSISNTPILTNLSLHNDLSQYQISESPPLLSPSTSTSSIQSRYSSDSKKSKVEELVYLFETVYTNNLYKPHRRYSVDNYTHENQSFIHERKFGFHPTVSQWMKRIDDNPVIKMTVSQSTPVRRKPLLKKA
ncbi:hypothetical protein BDB01DRAFT_779280 [Pilobolus umbonatus]|nr:hypothetical protein BDB01DRAFT_779280 [Pilobolus umbonatus]